MQTKRPFHETLNTGRVKRPNTTLEDISRTLEELEGRLSGRRDAMQPRPFAHAPAAPQPHPGRQQELDRLRRSSEEVAQAGQIAHELQSLREELRREMSTGIQREFDSLRSQLSHVYSDVRSGIGSQELLPEVERISQAVHSLSARSNDRDVEALRHEVEDLKHAIASLAREETLQNVNERWDDFDRRWDSIAHHMSDRAASIDAHGQAISSLSNRIDTISRIVGDLPSNQAIHALEDKIRMLANAIDHVAANPPSISPNLFAMVEDRLDEISRAIVASAVANKPAQFDPAPLERIEARISALTNQINEVAQALPAEKVARQLQALWDRIDAIAAENATPREDHERVVQQLASITHKLVEAPVQPDMSVVLQGVEDRIVELSNRIEHNTSAVSRQSSTLFADLEQRLAAIAGQIEQGSASSSESEHIIMDMERRFDDLNSRLDASFSRQGESERVIMDALEQRFRQFEDQVSRRAVESSAMPDPALFGTIEARLDATLQRQGESERAIMDTLEERFRKFEDQMVRSAKVGAAQPDAAMFENIEARLDASLQRQGESERVIMETLEERFRSFESRLAAAGSAMPAPSPDTTLAFQELENRLDEIAGRLDRAAQDSGNGNGALIRGLEDQIARLSDLMSKPAPAMADLDMLTPRLDDLERSLASSQENILQAARMAAEAAVRGASSGNDANRSAIEALAKDMRALDALARKSDERNTRTFEAVHETLLKVVDRLATLEDMRPAASAAPAPSMDMRSRAPAAEWKPEPAPTPKLEIPAAPSMQTDADFLLDAETYAPDRNAPSMQQLRMSPGEAAAAAALAALKNRGSEPAPIVDSKGKESLIAGLAKKLTGKKAASPAMGEPEVDFAPMALDDRLGDPMMPLDIDEPIEPGSGTPDLAAIMNRVRTDKGGAATDPEAAKADFIAAARRAAQAAAAEADILKGKLPAASKKSAANIGAMLAAKRKPLLMAGVAMLLVVVGLQMSKRFMGGDQVASIDLPAAVEPAETAAPADLTTRQAEPSVAATESAPQDAASADSLASQPSESVAAGPADTVPADMTAPAPADMAGAEPPKPASEPVATSDETPSPEPALAAAPAYDIDFGTPDFRKAVGESSPLALFETGARYAEGRDGAKTDLAKAAEFYRASAEAGFAPAQYRYGNFLEKGTGVERDIKAAKTWYQMAAEQGNASAMHNLAVLNATATDGAPDNESAVRWFVEAADLGVKDSQFNLGILAAKGIGMEPNLEESYKWFAIAARNGDKDAADKRDEVAKAMRPEQLEKARATADLWKPHDLNAEANSVDIPDSWSGPASQEKTAGIDMKKAVRNIQLILNKNGYNAGSADGVMGAKTTEAIRAFQKANGMEPTGTVDEALVKVLLAKK